MRKDDLVAQIIVFKKKSFIDVVEKAESRERVDNASLSSTINPKKRKHEQRSDAEESNQAL